jgi:TolA-binding protein
MAVLFPYYKKESIDYRNQAEQLQSQVTQLTQQVQTSEAAQRELERQLDQAQHQAEQNERDLQETIAQQRDLLSKTFLVVFIRWKTGDDIDLHVVDPTGAEFYYSNKTIPDHPGELSEDSTHGPGNEVWEIRDAPAGSYRVYANLYRIKDDTVPVIEGRLFHRDGSKKIGPTRITEEGNKILMATVSVGDDGAIHIQ